MGLVRSRSMSTLGPGWVSKRAQHAHDAAVAFIAAPVVGLRLPADAGARIFLAGGDTASFDRLKPTLLRMGSAVHHVSEGPAGAHTKLLANSQLTTRVIVIAELSPTHRG